VGAAPGPIGDQIWRVRLAGRVVAPVLCVGGWSALAIGMTIGGGVPVVTIATVWCIAPVVAAAVWRFAFVPRIVLGTGSVTVYNPILHTSIDYADIETATPGYSGLTIVGRNGRRVSAWAVQKSNAARWVHKQTRADEVAQAIMARVTDRPAISANV